MLIHKNVQNTGLGVATYQCLLAMKDTEVWNVSKNTRVKTAGYSSGQLSTHIVTPEAVKLQTNPDLERGFIQKKYYGNRENAPISEISHLTVKQEKLFGF